MALLLSHLQARTPRPRAVQRFARHHIPSKWQSWGLNPVSGRESHQVTCPLWPTRPSPASPGLAFPYWCPGLPPGPDFLSRTWSPPRPCGSPTCKPPTLLFLPVLCPEHPPPEGDPSGNPLCHWQRSPGPGGERGPVPALPSPPSQGRFLSTKTEAAPGQAPALLPCKEGSLLPFCRGGN